MAIPDYYEVLQVHPMAESEVVQAAYRRLAMKYHPDVSPGAQAQQRMSQLNQAYEILKDSQKRRAYDRQRSGATVAAPASRTEVYDAPQVEVLPRQVDFGAVALGQSRGLKIRVVNLGPGRLSGTIRCLAPWLRATPIEFSGNDVEVNVRFQPPTPGTFRSGNAVEVASGAGSVTIGASGTRVLTGQGAAPEGVASNRTWVDPVTTWSTTRPVVRRVDRTSVPFAATVAIGAMVTGALWFAIYPPLAVIPAGLAAYLLWRRHHARARGRQPVVRQARRGPTGLGRCEACGTKLDISLSAKCAHCGGTICGGCGVCPCGRAQH
ncbi:MAG: J domain-containing protein [Dehalococcoidia bacterium]|nr:J domain-containing protein [Dehalococcoidia bacterium]